MIGMFYSTLLDNCPLWEFGHFDHFSVLKGLDFDEFYPCLYAAHYMDAAIKYLFC